MDQRLGRTVRVFLVVLATAGLYRLAVVPWVEPRYREPVGVAELTPEQAAAIRARADRRLDAVRELFPPGSWELDQPIILESRGMRLMFKQYHSLPDGRVNLVPCTLVVLPDDQRQATEEPGRTLVMRAPQGAVLEFAEPLDLRAGRLSRLVGGSLRGQVTVRGTPSAAGAGDDIEVVTRDLELDEYEIRTNERVEFRYGRSIGRGRGLVAMLLPQSGGSGQGPNIGGVDTVRLEREVELRLEGMAAGIMPAAAAADTVEEPTAELPVHVTCTGSLTTNLSANVITLEDAVEVRRGQLEQGGDQLSCDVLAIILGEPSPAAEEAAAGLQVVEIQASGAPVIVRSGTNNLEVRTERLGYEVRSRRIRLDGDEPVTVTAVGLELEAASLDYTPDIDGGPGSLLAEGPGWLRALGERPPAVETRWQKSLRVHPDGTNHVASLTGQAEVAVDLQGRLTGAEMHLWFSQRAGATGAATSGAGVPNMSALQPQRLLVRGVVEVDVAEVAARTDRMELWFKPGQAVVPAVSPPAAADRPPVTSATAASPPPQSLPPRRPIPAIRPPLPVDRKLLASGDLIRGQVLLGGDQNNLEELSLEGQVQLIEQPAAAAAADGFDIRGDQLQITRPTRFDARAIISGRPAEIRSSKLNLEGPLIEFDRGQNRVAVDGGGRLTVPAAGNAGLGDLGLISGQAPRQPAASATTTAEPLAINWQGRMDFDGQTARFIDRVETGSGDTELKAGSLDCVFSQPIDFSRQRQPQAQAQNDIARIACGNGVRIISRTKSETDGQLESHEQLFVRDLFFDRLTGDVRGTGPGRLTSTRRGEGSLPLGTPALPGGPVQQEPVVPSPKNEQPGITYLGVDFQRGFTGNLTRRQMEFQQRVETIWGPVPTWEDSLDLHAPAGLAEGVVAVTSDVLGIGQTPPVPGQPRRAIELSAGGNVLVEGSGFTARSARLSYSELKDLLVFEGDGRTDAQLYRQERVGGPTSTASAGKILYWRQHNRVDVQDARYLDFDQLGGGSLPNAPF